ncbi:MAG: YicC family protein [Candidatus Abyssubacteria bacterium]
MRSMTGFGQGTIEEDGMTVSAEVSSLNHRYLDISARLAPPLNAFENEVRKLVQQHFERGRVTVFLNSGGAVPQVGVLEFDRNLARQYIDHARAFALETGIKDDIGSAAVARIGALWNLRQPRAEELGRLWSLCERALTSAMQQLLRMRQSEGANLWADLSQKVAQVQAATKDIASRAPSVIEEYRQKLKERIETLLPVGAEIDEQRILNEVALFADRADISEELVRIDSHIEQFYALAQQENNVGRRLDFLLQEMFREITTIGSKARSADISHTVVEVKGLLERMREQVQNVE